MVFTGVDITHARALGPISFMALLAISGCRVLPGSIFPHTPGSTQPDDERLWPGERNNQGGEPNPQSHRGLIQVWLTQRKRSEAGKGRDAPYPVSVMVTG